MSLPKHLIRYGTNADQKYFGLEFENSYDAIAINANMIAFSPNTISAFITKKAMGKGFFVDPITHAFQHNQSFITGVDELKIKKSIANLIDAYGGKLESIISEVAIDEKGNKTLSVKRPLLPADIDEAFIEEFAKNVINFQQNVVKEKEIEYNPYLEFAKEHDDSLTGIEIQSKPLFYVAPYFFLESENDWLEINQKMIKEAKKNVSDKPMFAEIVISKKLILRAISQTYEKSDLKNIVDVYKKSDADGFLIWIDRYNEHEEIAESLNIYIELLKDLNESKKPVYSLYGSYFSVILTHKEIKLLTGVCHGLEYGEARDVVPVGGGLPMPKFYFYPLHNRVNFSDMLTLLKGLKIKTREQFFADICKCLTCKDIITSDDIISNFSFYGVSNPTTFKRGAS